MCPVILQLGHQVLFLHCPASCPSLLQIRHRNIRQVLKWLSSVRLFTVVFLRFFCASNFRCMVIAFLIKLLTSSTSSFPNRCSSSNFSPLIKESINIFSIDARKFGSIKPPFSIFLTSKILVSMSLILLA